MAKDDEHVYPVGDLVEHELSENCICGPDYETLMGDDGKVRALIIHHSLDGREKHEHNG